MGKDGSRIRLPIGLNNTIISDPDRAQARQDAGVYLSQLNNILPDLQNLRDRLDAYVDGDSVLASSGAVLNQVNNDISEAASMVDKAYSNMSSNITNLQAYKQLI